MENTKFDRGGVNKCSCLSSSEKKSWKLVNFCEFDKYATKSYCAIHNVDESLNLGDITKVDETKLKPFNMICGGSPCQDFSVAGKQKGSVWTCKDCGHEYNPLTVHWSHRDKCPKCNSSNIEKTRSSLLVEYLRVIRANKPNFGIYENVKNIVGKQFRDTTFKLFEDELHEYGYNTYWKVLNAKNYGIPQNRERVYLIFIRKDLDNGQFKFPEPFDNGIRLKDILEDNVDKRFYLSDDRVKKFLNNFNQSDLPVTTRNSDTVSTIRSTYYKNGERNLCENIENGNGYEGIVESNELNQIGYINNYNGDANRVYSSDGCGRTLKAEAGVGGAKTGWYAVRIGTDKSNNNPKIIDNANCITSREDRGISSRKAEGTAVIEYEERGHNDKNIVTSLISHRGEQFEKATDVSAALLARDYKGFDNQPMSAVVEIQNSNLCDSKPKERFFKQAIETLEDSDADYGDTIDAYNRRVNSSGYSPTITTRPEGFKTAILPVTKDIRIRKLTPKECFRLMGFSDQDFEAAKNVGISNSQLYKQAGNSIVVDVLYYIYVELYKAMPYLFDDLKLSSFFSGIGAFESALDKLYEGINSGNFTYPQVG